MALHTRAFISTCSVCAHSKPYHQSSPGLLHPLSTPSRLWSHIAVYFVSGLSSSNGSTIILTIVDRFSKAVHFIPLPKLPTASETADLLVVHVFRLHGIPKDIVSDRGSHPVSGKPSAKPWAQLPAWGYHPQNNSQTERASLHWFSAPLFPVQEKEVSVPSVQANLRQCREV